MADWTDMIVAVAAALAIPQLIIWFNNRYSGPRRKIHLQNQQPLVGLKTFGFSLVSSAFEEAASVAVEVVGYVGQIEGYKVEITFEYQTGWTVHPHFKIRVFFGFSKISQESSAKQLEEIIGRSQLFRWSEDTCLKVGWAENKLTLNKFSPPTSQHIISRARRLVRELQKLGLPPSLHGTEVELP